MQDLELELGIRLTYMWSWRARKFVQMMVTDLFLCWLMLSAEDGGRCHLFCVLWTSHSIMWSLFGEAAVRGTWHGFLGYRNGEANMSTYVTVSSMVVIRKITSFI